VGNIMTFRVVDCDENDTVLRTISVMRSSELINGGREIRYTESWVVPDDFTDEELALYEELCLNGVVSMEDAQKCVLLLRE
jgi:hypothetical protein